jgi:hypothetical protein
MKFVRISQGVFIVVKDSNATPVNCNINILQESYWKRKMSYSVNELFLQD